MSIKIVGRIGVLLGAILGTALVSQGPVAAQGTTPGTFTFYTDDALSKAWTRLDNTTPLVEWGDTLWVKFSGSGFEKANGAPPVTIKFRLVVSGTAAPPASDYGFEVDANQLAPNGTDYCVGVDMGFHRTGAGPNVVWRIGVPQLAKTWPNGNANNKAADSKKAAVSPLAGMANPPAPDKIVLTPGEWEVFASQNTYPDTAPFRFRIMNPLTIQLYDPYAQVLKSTPWTDATANGQVYSDPKVNAMNGNAVFGTNSILTAFPPPTPPVGFDQFRTFGQVDHGRASASYPFAIGDRSRLDQVVKALIADASTQDEAAKVHVAFRLGAGDMNPMGAPDVTNPPNPAQPKDAFTTNLEDYPPIYRDRLSFQKYGGVEDPRQQDVTLRTRADDTANSFPLNPDLFTTQVRVLQYQPDTTYSTGQAVPTPSVGTPPLPTDPVRVWVDVNGDGKLNRVRHPDDPNKVYVPEDPTNPREPASYELLSDFAEPYREFNVTVNVPTDFRLAVQETTIDLGKHAHNVFSAAGSSDQPAMRPFTVKNLGNVNLRRLRVADKYVIEGVAGDRGISLYSPDTEFDKTNGLTAGLGLFISPEDFASVIGGQAPRKQILWSFNDVPTLWEDTTNGNEYFAGGLAKARPGAPSPTSISGTPDPAIPGLIHGPRVAVISPFGMPVGTYANQFLVYEDNYPLNKPDNRLDYRNLGNGAYQAMDTVATAPFTLKISVTDRQLTEEPGAYGLDRPIVGLWNGTTAVRPDSFVKFPDNDRQLAGDSQPAVVRFPDSNNPAHHRLALFWTSNRPDARQPSPPDANQAKQDWYLYGARTYEIKDSGARSWPFWGKDPYYDENDPAKTKNPPEFKFPTTTLFPALANTGTLAVERYTSPSITRTYVGGQPTDPAYLFFQGMAYTRDAMSSTKTITHRASQLFYTQLDSDMKPTGAVVPVGPEQSGLLKHGVRAVSYRSTINNSDYLWAFWYSGTENSWQTYYSVNKVDKAKADDWKLGDGTREAVLPIYGDFSYIQDPVPTVWSGYDGQGNHRDFIDIVFTGFSKSRRNSDIYMARLDPIVMEKGGRASWRAKQAFARVRGEVLANSKNRAYFAQHLEWLTRPYVDAATKDDVFPIIYRKDASGKVTQLTADPANKTDVAKWRFDQTEYSYTYEFDYTSVDHPELNGKNTVTIYPLAGLVMFARPMDATDVILADYTPSVLRVAGSPQMEASPSAFLDTRLGPAETGAGTRVYAPRHRLWLFSSRVAPQVANPTIWYKTMRLMVQLPQAIDPTKGVTIQNAGGKAITAFTIDSDKGRIYFPTYQTGADPMSLEGQKITVTYNGGGGQPTDPYIRWQVETADTPLPIDTVVNEGKVWAIPDIAPAVDPNVAANTAAYLNDPGTWRVWVFWSSSRPKATVIDQTTNEPAAYSYDTDLRYMTIAPRLDFRPDLP